MTMIVDPATVVPEPWRNGRGTTRTLAVGPGWRVSLAELTEDGPFSTFSGRDRLFTPLGEDFELVIDGAVVPAVRQHPIAFPGEATVELRRLSAPTQALNLMTERDVCRGEVRFVPPGAVVRSGEVVRVRLGVHDAVVIISPASPPPPAT